MDIIEAIFYLLFLNPLLFVVYPFLFIGLVFLLKLMLKKSAFSKRVIIAFIILQLIPFPQPPIPYKYSASGLSRQSGEPWAITAGLPNHYAFLYLGNTTCLKPDPQDYKRETPDCSGYPNYWPVYYPGKFDLRIYELPNNVLYSLIIIGLIYLPKGFITLFKRIKK